jgi:CDP-diacylglycerol--serine O-phosphatidyltransferase
MKQIPNLFTLLNLIFGCLAIVCVLQNGIDVQYNTDGSQFIDIPEKIWMASLFVGLAGVVDFLDGFVARLFKATSEMGKQLDSLADVVSFGVVPSMIFYQFLRMSFAKDENGLDVSIFYLMPAFLIAAAAAYRLAKFNLDQSQSTTFKGVPTPAVGILVASFPLIYWNTDNLFIIDLLLNKWALYFMILALCYLMISNLPIMSLKIKNKGVKENLHILILLILSLSHIINLNWLSIPIIFITYIILSLIFKNKLKESL